MSICFLKFGRSRSKASTVPTYVFVILLSIFLSLLPAIAQTGPAGTRYGTSYPLTGAGLHRLIIDVANDSRKLRAAKIACRTAKGAKRRAVCDDDKDKFVNARERRLRTNPNLRDTDGDGLSDRAEIFTSHTNPLVADTDGDGISDGSDSDPLTPNTTPACAGPDFDANGNTSSFGIPAGLTGNLGQGTSIFSTRCMGCHGDRGAGFTFDRLKAAVTGPLMRITYLTDQDFAHLTAYVNRAAANAGCAPTPGPGATPTATPIVTPTPTPTPYTGPGCGNQYFDGSGNTSQFQIPPPLIGNIAAGQSYFSLACSSCHGERGTGFTFPQLKAAVTGPLMNIQTVTDQQYADLTAFLNRSLAPQNCGPVPTPTPLDDISAGRLVYQSTCQSCHSDPRVFIHTSESDIREAIREVPEMNGINLSAEQMRVLLIYFHSL